MKKVSSFIHGIYRLWVRTILRIRFDFQIWGSENLPDGPKIFCSNHFSSSDANFVTTLMKDHLHMVIGPGFGIPVVRFFLRVMEQISAYTKEDRKHVVQEASRYLREGDSIYIFPEGRLNTMEKLDIFRPGVARIYLETGCPVIPIGLIAPKRRVRDKQSRTAGRKMTVVNKNYYVNIGEAMTFPEEMELSKTDRKKAEEMILEKLQNRIEFLIDDIKTNRFWS